VSYITFGKINTRSAGIDRRISLPSLHIPT
jgi:hypothetical protein